jgi:hypothetical protein
MDGDEEEREKRTIPAGRAKTIRSFPVSQAQPLLRHGTKFTNEP